MKKIRGQEVLDPKVRIARLTTVNIVSGCWEWNRPEPSGYGHLIVGSRTDGTRRSMKAHRYSYAIYNGTDPGEFEVCHRCDNRRCVNPEHLFLGTRQDNIDDREVKGRNKPQRGSANGSSKLTEDSVAAIRSIAELGMTQREIAQQFGLHRSTVGRIISMQAWKPAPPQKPVSDEVKP